MLRLLRSNALPVPQSKPERIEDPLQALAQRALRGDSSAECTLLTAVGPAMLRTVRGVLGGHHPEVPDVCQEAAISLLDALPRFRWQCSTLHFACRVAVLTAMNARRRVRFSSTDGHELAELEDSAPSPAEAAEATLRRTALRELLDELPTAQAEVLALHTMLGHTVDETAAIVGIPANTVRSRLRRALTALRQRIHADTDLLEVIRGGDDE